MPRFKITDTLTFAREWIVEARDEEHALDRAYDEGQSSAVPGTLKEQHVDASPYDAEAVDDEEE